MKLSYIWSKFFTKLRGKSLRGSNADKTSFINSGCNIVNSEIGKYTYLGYDCWVTEAEIGAFCSISNNVRIGGAAHPMEFVSMSPVFHKGKNVLGKNFSEHEFEPFKRTAVGNDVWIGENSIIKAGVTIGNGAVIGTGSVVTKNVGAYEIWAGNPAKLIRKRFDDETAAALDASHWWEFSDEKLKEISKYMNDPEKFINFIKQ